MGLFCNHEVQRKRPMEALTWSFCPVQETASCFGWWWRAGVQPKSKHYSSCELLRGGGRRRWGWTLHAERKEVGDSPVVAAVERWVLRWLDSFLPWLLEPFLGLLLVRWVFYSGAEQRPPRWLPRHRNLILSAVTLGPLATFRLTVFDFMCKNTVVRPVLLLKMLIKCDMLLWRYIKFSAVYTLSSQNYIFYEDKCILFVW